MIGGVLAMAMGTAHAQEAAPIATFLEKRVPDELAVEGVMLSRRDLSLKIEQVGEQFVISLVDLSTGQIAASTKLDSLPPDREAAVAAVTHVVAELSRQVGPQAAAPPAQTRAQTLQDQRDQAQYKRVELRIGERYELGGTRDEPSLLRNWVVYRGEQNHELDPETFYNNVGRPDFARIYADRISMRNKAITVAAVTGAAAITIAIIGAVKASSEGSSATCDVHTSDFANCVDQAIAAGGRSSSDLETALGVSGLFLLGTAIAIVIANHYHSTANPVTEDEAMTLADNYNRGLRRRLNLPTAQREPVLESLKVAPFAIGAHDGGGIALGGTF